MRSLRFFLLLAVAVSPIHARADKSTQLTPAPAEVIARVRAAHSIFIANATIGAIIPMQGIAFRQYYGYTPYKNMYYALAAWPGVKLVDSPSDADLIFEVTGSETWEPRPPGFSGGSRIIYSALSIIDPQTQTVLWTTSLVVAALSYDDRSNSHFDKAVVSILASLEPQQPAPQPLKVTVPLPSQLKATSKVFLQPSSSGYNPNGINVSDLAQASLIKAKLYTLVDTPEQADLILTVTADFHDPKTHTWDSGTLLITAIDPKTKVVIWTQLSSLVAGSKAPGTNAEADKNYITKTMSFALKFWKSLMTQKQV
jgi:hypothetical protein